MRHYKEMFLELPSAIQERIYDTLHIRDRRSLNIALSKRRITKTVRTDMEKDRKLAALSYAMKKKGTWDVSRSRVMMDFIGQNLDDPTVAELVSNNQGVNLTTTKIKSAITNGSMEELVSVAGDPVPPFDYPMILDALARHGTPSLYDACMKHPCLPVIKQHISSVGTQYITVFNSVNYMNRALTEYLVSREEMAEGCAHFLRPEIASIFVPRTDATRLILQLFAPPVATVEEMMKAAVLGMHLDTADVLASYMKNI